MTTSPNIKIKSLIRERIETPEKTFGHHPRVINVSQFTMTNRVYKEGKTLTKFKRILQILKVSKFFSLFKNDKFSSVRDQMYKQLINRVLRLRA